MEISLDSIKELRELTSCGVAECKKALEQASGDMKKAKEILQKRGLEIAIKKGSRVANEGRVESYIHLGSKIGVLVEVNCETDFVAKNQDFIAFSKDLAMHIAASDPKYTKKENIPAEVLQQQHNPDQYIKETCLLEQPFIKDSSITIQDYLNTIIGKIGENIQVNRFARYKVGQVE